VNKTLKKRDLSRWTFALDQGVNFWDTAELYAVPPKEETFGHTEIIIGNWFEKQKIETK
jgi:aryl-alcohol dehydrogenase-like predicted oxidoreductase